MLDWHKNYLKWWQKKLNLSTYALCWISFVKGVIIGLLINHFWL